MIIDTLSKYVNQYFLERRKLWKPYEELNGWPRRSRGAADLEASPITLTPPPGSPLYAPTHYSSEENTCSKADEVEAIGLGGDADVDMGMDTGFMVDQTGYDELSSLPLPIGELA